ncbi:hypothetical protein DFS34DRAFT_598162 [Phlyctochytrium arcticum]|nr:hypothetical protein DFS34DRAFT_598162 [Phlyctochytrium arcticum]
MGGDRDHGSGAIRRAKKEEKRRHQKDVKELAAKEQRAAAIADGNVRLREKEEVRNAEDDQKADKKRARQLRRQAKKEHRIDPGSIIEVLANKPKFKKPDDGEAALLDLTRLGAEYQTDNHSIVEQQEQLRKARERYHHEQLESRNRERAVLHKQEENRQHLRRVANVDKAPLLGVKNRRLD